MSIYKDEAVMKQVDEYVSFLPFLLVLADLPTMRSFLLVTFGALRPLMDGFGRYQ